MVDVKSGNGKFAINVPDDFCNVHENQWPQPLVIPQQQPLSLLTVEGEHDQDQGGLQGFSGPWPHIWPPQPNIAS